MAYHVSKDRESFKKTNATTMVADGYNLIQTWYLGMRDQVSEKSREWMDEVWQRNQGKWNDQKVKMFYCAFNILSLKGGDRDVS